MTEAHKRRNQRSYLKKVAENRCVCCGIQDERTLSGLRYCRECMERHRANASPRKPKTPKQREAENADKREWRSELIRLHACISCGTKDRRTTVNGYELCVRCAAKKRKWQQDHKDLEKQREYAKARRDRWRELGRCTYCGGSKEEPDKMLCIDCRVKAKMKRIKREVKKRGQNYG